MTNVLEWLEHMEGQAGEKIAVADPKEKYSFTQLKTYAQKSGTYLRKWMTGTFPVAIYMEKKLCHIKYYAWSGICRMSVLSVRSASAGCETAADSEGAAAGSDCYKGRKSGKNQKLRR